MNIFIQEKYKDKINLTGIDIAKIDLAEMDTAELNSNSEHLIIGDSQFCLQKKNEFKQYSLDLYYILIQLDENLNFHFLQNILPMAILNSLNEQQIQTIPDIICKFKNTLELQNKINFNKSEIQNKRKILEESNENLFSESQAQLLDLEKSHAEELQKSIIEKNLLHFLDFIQSESENAEFLSLLLKFIWKDLRKISKVFQIGFCIKYFSYKSQIFTFDGLNESTISEDIDLSQFSEELTVKFANLLGRPAGKLSVWPLSHASCESYFFVEILDPKSSHQLIENYIKERISVLSLYLDKWIIQKEYEIIINRWAKTFKSFSGFVHVIDDEFNIYQSNYFLKMDSKLNSEIVENNKCYNRLANRTEPCQNCPILTKKTNEFNLKNGLSVKTYTSEFLYNSKKYFFVIYEDVTQLNTLKGQMVYSEKMSALGRLGNHLAHELNNPLTGIKSYIQSLLSEPTLDLNSVIQSDLNEILKAIIRSQNIIQNFINFSQKKESQLEVVEFGDILNNVITLLKSVLRPHRLFIDIKSKTLIKARSHDLQQVLFNLIKNSCQAMNFNGTIKIYELILDTQIYFIIEDSGHGFPAEILEHLFEPFRTTKEKGEGTGLGLYLSKKLMLNMNADILIENNGGAKMTLVFDKV